MGLNEDGASGFDYKDFQKRLAVEDFNPTQAAMIKLRLELLENFLEPTNIPKTAKPQNEPKHVDTAAGKRATRAWYYNKDQLRRAKIAQREIWSFSPGSLTIVDLSCPFVDEGAACTLFNMCLSIFLDGRTDEPVDARKDGSKGKRKDEEKGEPKEISRIIALDEAHKVNCYSYCHYNPLHERWILMYISLCLKILTPQRLRRLCSLLSVSRGILQHELSLLRKSLQSPQNYWIYAQ